MLYNQSVQDLVRLVKQNELEEINFNKVIMNTSLYYIRPTIALTMAGEPMAQYGVFNKETQSLEADTRQFGSAVQWMHMLTDLATKAKEGNIDIPQLDNIVNMFKDGDDDDGGKVH